MKSNNDLISTVKTFFTGNETVIVGYSGGVDSTVLLHILAQIKKRFYPNLNLSAVHIHHGISKNADDWLTFCEKICCEWNVPFHHARVKLNLNIGNIEQQARDARCSVFKKHMATIQNQSAILCTAQHLDDQVETFFLALKRGSGPTGLSSMPQIKAFYEHQLIRPFLTIKKNEINFYAKENNLMWVEDESNKNQNYDRNFLRESILPEITKRWPQFSDMVVRSAELCGQQQQLLDSLLQESFSEIINDDGSLSINPLKQSSVIKKDNLMRMWFQFHNQKMPSRQQLKEIWTTVICAKEDANPKILLHRKQIRRYKNRLYLLPFYSDISSVVLNWNLINNLELPDHLGFLSVSQIDTLKDDNKNKRCRAPQKSETATVKFSINGNVSTVNRDHSRRIKKLWQELNIPPWQRNRIPLIFYNETLICAIGVFVTKEGEGKDVMFTVKNQ